MEHNIDTAFQLPLVLTRKLTPMKYRFPVNWDEMMQEVWPTLTDYYEGCNTNLIELITQKCEKRELLQSFAGSLILDDIKSMKHFYERCSHRNFQIRQQLGLNDEPIPQQKLDDYLIEWAFNEED